MVSKGALHLWWSREVKPLLGFKGEALNRNSEQEKPCAFAHGFYIIAVGEIQESPANKAAAIHLFCIW